jgi:hypothetical protein
MLAVMHDPTASLWTRLEAAAHLLPYEEQRQPTLFACGDKDVHVVIHIGGLGEQRKLDASNNDIEVSHG